MTPEERAEKEKEWKEKGWEYPYCPSCGHRYRSGEMVPPELAEQKTKCNFCMEDERNGIINYLTLGINMFHLTLFLSVLALLLSLAGISISVYSAFSRLSSEGKLKTKDSELSLTSLQLTLLNQLLSHGSTSGSDLLSYIRSKRISISGPSFYQVMAKLEANGMVSGWDEQQELDGATWKSRTYSLNNAGLEAVREYKKSNNII